MPVAWDPKKLNQMNGFIVFIIYISHAMVLFIPFTVPFKLLHDSTGTFPWALIDLV